jgi:hypothetical protein
MTSTVSERVPGAFLALLLLCGCNATAIAEDTPLQTRVTWRDDCPNAPKPKDVSANATSRSGLVGAVFAAVAPKLISGAVDAAAAALTAAGQDKAKTSTARIDSDFYRVNQLGDLILADRMGCVVTLPPESVPHSRVTN